LFGNASQHVFPTDTNISDNKFEVNSALLIETIGAHSTQSSMDSYSKK